MKMLDYVAMATSRMDENLARADSLVAPAVEAFRASKQRAIRIVASGSSRHAADCARDAMERALGIPVVVETPEVYVAHVGHHALEAFNIAISQSGYSTNILAALDSMKAEGESVVALTGNVGSPIAEHVGLVVDYGVGVESVDFVTMGVVTLIEFLVLFAASAAGELESMLQGLEDAVGAHAAAVELSGKFVKENELVLSRMAPVVFVGNGPQFGVAEEASLKFSETLKVPAMHFEGEEFIHGPEMQLTPDYTVFIIDEPQGSARLASIASAVSKVTDATYFVTSRPKGEPFEVVMPDVRDPFLSGIPSMALFQYIAAHITERVGRWDVHPYLADVEKEFAAKAEGYDEAVKNLELEAARKYVDKAL